MPSDHTTLGQAPVQDENAVFKATKISGVASTDNPIANANSTSQRTGSSVFGISSRPALSNVTNTTATQPTASSSIPTSKIQTRSKTKREVALIEKKAEAEITEASSEEQNEEHAQQQQQPQQLHSRMALKRTATETSTDQPANVKRSKTEYQWENLDADDIDDPLMAADYADDIFDYLSELEVKTLPDSKYLQKQADLKPKMRSILVDWIVEVHLRFRLLPETLFLAINIMDRFMSKETVQVDKLQLLATGSLFIAAKYEEVYSPSVKNYSYVTDGGYSEEDILSAERYILQVLNFDLSYANPMNFLRRISKADDYDIETRTVGKYLLEISIMDHRFIGIKPSLCAAAAMFVSRRMLKRAPWNGTLIHYSGGYTKNDMKHVVDLLMNYLVEPVQHEEFFKKYASKKYMKSSILARHWAKVTRANEEDVMED